MTAVPLELTPVSHRVTESQIAKYADAAGDHNPLHLDAEFAASTPYGRPIAHGMLVLAFVSEMLTRSFGRSWLCGGKLKARFRAPVFPGETVTTAGTLKSTSDGMATYVVVARNQDGTVVITGDAVVPVTG